MAPVAALSGVRRATPNDLSDMVELSYRLADKTMYARIPRNRPAIVNTMVSCMSSQFACALISHHGEKLTGILLGVAQQYWWSRKRYATDLIFYSERAGHGMQLVKQFIAWAKNVPGVVEITMGQSSGINVERSERFYKRAGLVRIGGMFTKVLQETL